METLANPPLARRRPAGITVLAAVLALMAVSGLANALIWRSALVQELLAKVDPTSLAWLGTPVFTAIMLAYGVCAASSAVGLWRMRSWSVWAYVAWCASMAAGVVYFRAIDTPEEIRTANMVLGAISCAVFLLVCPYIARNTRAAPAAE